MGLIGLYQTLLLVALGIGYIVISIAKKEQGYLRFLGIVIGTIIIFLSLFFMFSGYIVGCNLGRVMGKRMMPPRTMMPQQGMPPQAPPAK